MPVQIIVCLAIVTVTVFLAMLLHQARRTAVAMEKLAESAAKDLRQVAEDVHAVRTRVVEVTDLAKSALEMPSALTQVVSGLVRAIPVFFGGTTVRGNFLKTLLTGLQTALHLFRRPKATPKREECHE